MHAKVDTWNFEENFIGNFLYVLSHSVQILKKKKSKFGRIDFINIFMKLWYCHVKKPMLLSILKFVSVLRIIK